uniref:Uncharacterized protein n=1 Tax=Mus spicilegus TaxID=10103 RepID=A0A8C6HX15_MUSSI
MGVVSTGHCDGHMSRHECLLPGTKCHPESRLARLNSSDSKAAEEMNPSDKRHPQRDTLQTQTLPEIVKQAMRAGMVLECGEGCEKRWKQQEAPEKGSRLD